MPGANEAKIGWRVELRTMEVQLTDFENAAFTVFCVLVLRVLLSFDLNIYMPMSKVQENMQAAHVRDAATRPEAFWWRSHLVNPGCTPESPRSGDKGDVFERMSVSEILGGKGGYYPGLVPLVLVYLESIGCDPDTSNRVKQYVDLIVPNFPRPEDDDSERRARDRFVGRKEGRKHGRSSSLS